MDNVKLMFDIDSSPEFIVEESINESTGKTEKKYKIKGVFSTIGERNRNGRIYPHRLWENEVNKYQNIIQTGSINTLMEYEHPARTSVDPLEAVAKINSLEIKGKFVMGEAILLDNPKANQLKSLIDVGVKISVSSRGVGSIKNGIVENFKLVTYDIVTTPSDFNATMNGLVESYQLNEGVINNLSFAINDDGVITSIDESQTNNSDTYNRDELNQAIMTKFSDIMNKLKKS